jgi:nucleotide-binding universal stress UspA family protein
MMDAPPIPSSAAERPRRAHVACHFDGSEAGRRSLAEARRHVAPGGRLSVLYVETGPLLPIVSFDGAAWIPDDGDLRARLRDWLQEELRGVPGAVPVVLEGHPGHEICAWALEADPDLIVAARQGLVSRVLRGNVVRTLLRRAPCSVLVLQPQPAGRRPAPRLAPAS